MKTRLIFLLFIFNNIVWANQNGIVFEFARQNKLYFSAYELLKEISQGETSINPKKISEVLVNVHHSIFIHDRELEPFYNMASSLDYPVAIQLFFKGKYQLAEERLNSIKPYHPLYIERSYLKGLISLTRRDDRKAASYFSSCIKTAFENKHKGLKSEDYVRMFRNRCVQQLSRILFSMGRYKDNLKILNTIEKTDFLWPNTLLERAWTYYHLKHRPLALGTLITFQAPILNRYMRPEAKYLKALLYHEMCYFEKAQEIYQEFTNQTWNNRQLLKQLTPNLLYKLIHQKEFPSKKEEIIIFDFLKSYKKDIRFQSLQRAITQINNELRILKKAKNFPKVKKYLAKLKYSYKIIQFDFRDFLKNLLDDYSLQIENTHRHFLKLNLLLNIQKRKQLSQKTKEKQSEELIQLSLKDIGKVDKKFIWNFLGGFWADELGDYAVALEDRCQ